MQTYDAEITLPAHLQRAPVGGSGVKAKQQMDRRGRREQRKLSIFRRFAPVIGQLMCLHRREVAAFSSKQGGTAGIPVLVSHKGKQGFFISQKEKTAYDRKTMASLN